MARSIHPASGSTPGRIMGLMKLEREEKSPEKTVAGRLWEVDALRGLAVVVMLGYHLVWDLDYFGHYRTDLDTGIWPWIQQIFLTVFIFLVGLSLWLSYTRRGRIKFSGYFSRGLKILGWGVGVTVATRLFLGEGTVFFGILHFIGVSVICAYPLIRLGVANMFLGAAFIAATGCLSPLPDSPFLAWLGLSPLNLYTVDHVPIFPWLGVVLLGSGTGRLLYPGGQRRIELPYLDMDRNLRFLTFLGRNSLLIYLLHQPVFFGLFFAGGFLWKHLH